MNFNRQVLRPTHNRLPLQDVSSHQKYFCIDKTNLHVQQENRSVAIANTKISVKSRPILTAARLIKSQFNENDVEMLISPMVDKTNVFTVEQTKAKTREQCEEDLYELSDYRQSIFDHLRSVEHVYAPKINFMKNQSDVNASMRTVLVDWLVEVTDEYKLTNDTLFLCVQYVDRFLSTVNVTRSKLQLLGTTCMYVAAKYEEMYPPALEEFSFITDNTYDCKHILRMEQIVIKMLNFSLSGPTSYTFLQYYLTHLKSSTSFNLDDDTQQCLMLLSTYLCTLTLLHDRPFSSYRSSLIAASCLVFAFQLLNLKPMSTSTLKQLTTYTEFDLNECKLALIQIHSETYRQEQTTSSVLRRYLNPKNNKELYQKRVHDLIHQSKLDDDDDVIDLTLDEIDENDVSMEHHR
ncbi:unnamed protein product [Adineta ricciae]|nr:unnamed protein product [Adineta ricciae]